MNRASSHSRCWWNSSRAWSTCTSSTIWRSGRRKISQATNTQTDRMPAPISNPMVESPATSLNWQARLSL